MALALHWFKSYLEERKQVVKVEGSTPHSKDLKWGAGGGTREGNRVVAYTV